jgi:hypothetical protein
MMPRAKSLQPQRDRDHRGLRLVVAIGLLVILTGSSSGLRELPKLAIQKSQLTLPGSVPFHLTATVLNPKDPTDQAHTARIEEFWVSPQKWRRKVTAPDFSQLLIVNGGRVHEEITGGYDPNWLRTLVNALFDPGAPLQRVDLTQSDDNPVRNTKQVCRRFATAVGIAPVSNDVFSTYCFLYGLIDGVTMPGYCVDYKDYAPFLDKQVSRRVQEYINRELQPEARIIELNVLKAPDESLFAITEAHPLLKTVFVTEQDARAHILDASPIVWPKIHEGQAVGLASIYVCIDREGRVRETHNLNNDHPDVADAAREQVLRWRFRQFMAEGVPVQAETILTWAYSTELE